MIIGIGSDLCDIDRIQAILDRYDHRFTTRLFTETERAYCDSKRLRAAAYAKRFAAKEACAKALGTGFRSGLFLRDIGVVNDGNGRPNLVLKNKAERQVLTLTPKGYMARSHLSLTDEGTYAQAFVVLEAVALCQ